MFMIAEKEGQISTVFFFSIFVSCCPCGFKQGQAEHVQVMKAQINRPRSQRLLI